MNPPRAGERVVFVTTVKINDEKMVDYRYHGTAMTDTVNGVVVVAVESRARSYGDVQFDENVLPVVAVRVDAIVAVDESNEPQGAKR